MRVLKRVTSIPSGVLLTAFLYLLKVGFRQQPGVHAALLFAVSVSTSQDPSSDRSQRGFLVSDLRSCPTAMPASYTLLVRLSS